MRKKWLDFCDLDLIFIRFWWPRPYFQDHYLIHTQNVSLMCTLSYESIDGILPKLAQMHHWDWGKKWLDFGDLISFSRSHRHFETQMLIGKSLCAYYTLNQWLEFEQTSTNRLLGHGKEVIRFLWPGPRFQGHYIIKTLTMSLVRTLSFFLISWKRSNGYSSISADTFISIMCTNVRKIKD